MSYWENVARREYEERNSVPPQHRNPPPVTNRPETPYEQHQRHAREAAWATQRLREQGKLRG